MELKTFLILTDIIYFADWPMHSVQLTQTIAVVVK